MAEVLPPSSGGRFVLPFEAPAPFMDGLKPEVEGGKDQNNSDIDREPRPRMISEEQNIHTDDGDDHQHDVECGCGRCLASHFNRMEQRHHYGSLTSRFTKL